MFTDIFNTDKKYDIIYADPPWGYANKPSQKGTSRGFAGYRYSLLSENDIIDLPIRNLSNENGVLFVWATFPMLKTALNVIEAWGFRYRTCAFVWVKKNKKSQSNFWGCGYYTRSNAELCLLATKGKTLPRLSRSVHQIIETPVEEHSKKPDIVRNKIIELFGDRPRIELFARNAAEGWDCWGDDRRLRNAEK